MALRTKGSWVLAGLGVIITLLGSSGFAMAGIVIKSGHTVPISDPQYEYVFDIQLSPGSVLGNGGYITVESLPYISVDALTSQPPLWSEVVTYVDTVNSISYSNITWNYLGNTPVDNNGSTPYDLGDFKIGPSPQLFTPPPPVTLDYFASLNGQTISNIGQITVTSIPEPSSVVLLLSAVSGGISLLLFRKRYQCGSALERTQVV